MDDDHVAGDAHVAALAKNEKPESFSVDRERQFAKTSLRPASRAYRETNLRIRVQHERITRRQRPHASGGRRPPIRSSLCRFLAGDSCLLLANGLLSGAL